MVTIRVENIEGVKNGLVNKKNKILQRLDRNIHTAGSFLHGRIIENIMGQGSPGPFYIKHKRKYGVGGPGMVFTTIDSGAFLRSTKVDNNKWLQSRIYSNVPYAHFIEYTPSEGGKLGRKLFRTAVKENTGEIKIILNNFN